MCEKRFLLSFSPSRISTEENFNPSLNKSPTLVDYQLSLINHSDFHMLTSSEVVSTYCELLEFPVVNSLQKY